VPKEVPCEELQAVKELSSPKKGEDARAEIGEPRIRKIVQALLLQFFH